MANLKKSLKICENSENSLKILGKIKKSGKNWKKIEKNSQKLRIIMKSDFSHLLVHNWCQIELRLISTFL